MPNNSNCDYDPAAASYGDGTLWHRTSYVIRLGPYGPTHTAVLKKPRFRQTHALPVSMSVKSASLPADVALLRREASLFRALTGSPFICNCFGEEITYKNDTYKGLVPIHNLLLEHSYRNLSSLIRDNKNKLSQYLIKKITNDVLQGISLIHNHGYMHCGLVPEILLIFNSGDRVSAKIGDLGLAKRASSKNKRVNMSSYLRRNLRYLAPEIVSEKVCEKPADVWAVGCIVMEMLTWRPMWYRRTEEEVEEGLLRIGEGSEAIRIPNDVSDEAKGFLKGCLNRKASRRLTVEMLLDHPFVASGNGES